MAWAAAALLLVAAAVPLWRGDVGRPLAPVGQDDAALLEQVDAELARPVPAAMQPLMDLVNGEPQGERGRQ
jgi:hypothetical protein